MLCTDDKHCVTVDGKMVVGRRLRHRAGVHRRRPHKARAALSPGLSGRRHGRWCRIRAPSSGRRSGPSDLSDANVPYTHATSRRGTRAAARGRLEGKRLMAPRDRLEAPFRFYKVASVGLGVSVNAVYMTATLRT